jgi:hypothetical protein
MCVYVCVCVCVDVCVRVCVFVYVHKHAYRADAPRPPCNEHTRALRRRILWLELAGLEHLHSSDSDLARGAKVRRVEEGGNGVGGLGDYDVTNGRKL